MAHDQDHALNSSANHLPGTNGTLMGTEAGAIVEKAFSASAAANAIVQRDGSSQIVVPNNPAGPGYATSKAYVDNVASGTRSPVKVLKMIDDSDMGGSPPAHGAGRAYVVNNWGGGYNDGDIIESTGVAWVVIVANVGSEPPTGTRVIVSKSPVPAGSFAAKANQIATYDATTNTWSFEAPQDGWSAVVAGDGGYYEGQQFIYDLNLDVWNTMGSLVPHNNLAGLQGGTVGEYYHLTQTQHTNLTKYKADVALAGVTPVNGDVAAWANGDRGIGVGTTGRIYWMYKDSGGACKSVHLN